MSWIKEWKEKADTKNAPVGKTYARAIQSLESCPKQFNHPQELQELQSFGPKICAKLEKKLREYCGTQGIDVPPNPVPPTVEQPRKMRKKRQWIPQVGSGGYAIVLALKQNENEYGTGQGMAKSDIIRKAKTWCGTPFKTNPKTGVYYSAWSSVKTLINNDLVYVSAARNAHYFLTETGRRIGTSLLQASAELMTESTQDTTSSTPAVVPAYSSSPISAADARPEPMSPIRQDDDENCPLFTTIRWHKGSYRIKLLIDNREIKSRTSREDFFGSELADLGISVDKKSLAVGDALWVAEHKHTGQTAVIDYILERKRVDDLLSSVFDGRFHEQKFRLSRSSLSNIIYLVEGSISAILDTRERTMYKSDTRKINYKQIIYTAMAQTVALSNFNLKRTNGPEETVRYMTELTHLIRDQYKGNDLVIAVPDAVKYKEAMGQFRARFPQAKTAIAYDAFNAAMSKSGMKTIRDVYLRFLMTVKGVTFEKALAIQKIYPTPRALFDAYEKLTNEDDKKAMIFKALSKNITRKKVGKAVSERLYECWGVSN